jgi:8-oxo-dGTP pyrophosphatase MutT (NUDIX family)
VEPEPWRTTASRVVFTHPWHPTLVEDDVVTPGGVALTWLRWADGREGPARPDPVLAICVDADGRVLLARQWCQGPQRVVAEFPGGNTDPAETYEDAIRRELMEEVGLFPHRLTAIGRTLISTRRSSAGLRWFVATDLERRSLPSDPGEEIAVEWVRPEEIDRRIAAGDLDSGSLLAGWALFRAIGPHAGRASGR